MQSFPIRAWQAALIAGFVGWFIGHWQGESQATEQTRKFIMLADLTPECEQMLRDGVDAANEEGDALNALHE